MNRGWASRCDGNSVVPRTFKTELGNCFINIHILLEMNQDQDKPIYMQKKVCKGIKRTEDALTELWFCISSPAVKQDLLSLIYICLQKPVPGWTEFTQDCVISEIKPTIP